MSLLEVEALSVRYGAARAVEALDCTLEAGEVLGLVGESGSGKSSVASALLGLAPPGARVEARRLALGGRELGALDERGWRALRGRELALVAQDPSGALDPLVPLGLQLAEVLEVHERAPRRAALERAADALAEVGLPERALGAYPHELSGGQRQRAVLAMAWIARPRLLVADEPTTALDVVVQAQILELVDQRRRAHGTAVLLITHSLAVVARVAERVLVLYAGRVVEEAPSALLFERPLHPYTRALLACAPSLARAGLPAPIPGRPPAPEARPSGCAFHPRCPLASARCAAERPLLRAFAGGGNAACHALEEGRA